MKQLTLITAITLSVALPASYAIKNLQIAEISTTSASISLEGDIEQFSCDGLTPTIIGTNESETINGTSGNDIIFSYGGNDAINAGSGNDIICSGAGNDLVKGGAGDDIIFDTIGDNKLRGEAGNDRLFAGDGNDDIRGQVGDDTIAATGGSNTIYGGAGSDTISGGKGNDTIFGNAGRDTIVSFGGSDYVSGGYDDDRIDCGSGDDICKGDHGDDILFGGLGDDTLRGDSGSNTIYGQDGADMCFEVEKSEGITDTFYNCENIISANDSLKENDSLFTQKPKVVLYVMLDDADYHDVGFNSQDAITPNIDALAEDGVILDNFYAASGICSPTRVSVVTGKNPLSYGVNRLWPDITSINAQSIPNQYYQGLRTLPTDIPFISDINQEGYKNLHIGKWHIGESQTDALPNQRGFDKSVIMKATPYEGVLSAKIDGVWEKTPSQSWRPQYQVDQIIDFIEQEKELQNVFVQWWPIEPHTPLYIPPNYDNTELGFDLSTNRGKLLSMMYMWDKEFGRVINYLKEQDLYDESLIILTSDNGGYRYALSEDRDVSGSKGTLSEGGIRVPFVATWPKVIPANTRSSVIGSTHDILPTLFEAVGKELPNDLDGVSLMSALSSMSTKQTGPTFWQLRTRSWRTQTKQPGGFDGNDKTYDDMAFDTYAMRGGCYKLIKHPADPAGNVVENPLSLYNVCNDPGELNDLRDAEPSKYQSMQLTLKNLRLNATKIESIPQQTNGKVIVPFDQRLNTSHDDISIYLDVSEYVPNQKSVIYQRGEGLEIFISQTGLLTVNITGTHDTKRADAIEKTVSISHQIPEGTTGFSLGFVVHNYLRSGATIELYVDDVLTQQVASDFLTAKTAGSTGDSIFAIKNSQDDVQLGDENLGLSNINIYTTALRPWER